MSLPRTLEGSLLACALLLVATSWAGEPGGLDGRLKKLAADSPSAAALQQPSAQRAASGGSRSAPDLVLDDAGRVLVTVRLTQPDAADATLAALGALGFRQQARSLIDPRLVSGYLPPARLAEAQALPGVHATRAARKPVQRVGAVTSQAVSGLRADYAQATGFDGRGIRVGALSDSFDIKADALTRAARDIATGDLPAAGVTVLSDAPASDASFTGDEGRAMLQLVHDIAPGAILGYAASGSSQVEFANAILALRNTFGADIIVDDVVFTDEPFFSDGIAARAVDQVVASGAAYFSAVGNNSLAGYESVYQPLSFAAARDLAAQRKIPVKLEQIPAAQRPLSVHVFGNTLDGRTRVTQRVAAPGGCLFSFQWDELFDQGQVKTDYDLYLFNAKGDWIDPAKTGDITLSNNNNIATDQALEDGYIGLENVYLVIGKRNQGPAQRIRHVLNGTGCGTEDKGASTAFGHIVAKGTFSVGAVNYWTPKERATFSSPGHGFIYFDSNGKRLASPERRLAPKAMAIQGTDTTFFGYDFDNTGYPNFEGTSAAAPVAAGVAAQVLQAAGGRASLSPKALYQLMQSTARRMPMPDNADVGVANAGPVTLSVNGYSSFTHGYFRLDLHEWAEAPLRSVSIDLASAPYKFSDRLTDFGFSDNRGIGRTDVTPSVSSDGRRITFTASSSGKFKPGEAFSFRWTVLDARPILGGGAELMPYDMRGAVLTATLENGRQFTGKLVTDPAQEINRFTGWGLLDAAAATRSAPYWTGR